MPVEQCPVEAPRLKTHTHTHTHTHTQREREREREAPAHILQESLSPNGKIACALAILIFILDDT